MNKITYEWLQEALKVIQNGAADKLQKGNVKVYRVKDDIRIDITGGVLSDVFG